MPALTRTWLSLLFPLSCIVSPLLLLPLSCVVASPLVLLGCRHLVSLLLRDESTPTAFHLVPPCQCLSLPPLSPSSAVLSLTCACRVWACGFLASCGCGMIRHLNRPRQQNRSVVMIAAKWRVALLKPCACDQFIRACGTNPATLTKQVVFRRLGEGTLTRKSAVSCGMWKNACTFVRRMWRDLIHIDCTMCLVPEYCGRSFIVAVSFVFPAGGSNVSVAEVHL